MEPQAHCKRRAAWRMTCMPWGILSQVAPPTVCFPLSLAWLDYSLWQRQAPEIARSGRRASALVRPGRPPAPPQVG